MKSTSSQHVSSIVAKVERDAEARRALRAARREPNEEAEVARKCDEESDRGCGYLSILRILLPKRSYSLRETNKTMRKERRVKDESLRMVRS